MCKTILTVSYLVIILWISLEKGECFDFNHFFGCAYPTSYIIRLLRWVYLGLSLFIHMLQNRTVHCNYYLILLFAIDRDIDVNRKSSKPETIHFTTAQKAVDAVDQLCAKKNKMMVSCFFHEYIISNWDKCFCLFNTIISSMTFCQTE